MRLIFWRFIWIFEWLFYVSRSVQNSDVVLWIPRVDLFYFFRTSFVWDIELLKGLYSQQRSYRVFWGLRAVGKIKNCRVYYNPQYGINLFGDSYETRVYPIVSSVLEENGSLVDPSSLAIGIWENKVEMHLRFRDLDIPHPKTALSSDVNSCLNLLNSCDKVILKPSHSKSSIGIREIFNSEDLSAAFSSDMSGFVLQKVELIERDCRIVVIRDEVVLQYWRSKPQTIGDEFVTTATSNGSRVVFNDYPEDIAHFAITSTHKLGLHSAAWDLIVVDDKIYALEVSPIYYPNASENYDNEIPYRNYKASFFYLLYMRREFSKHIRKRLGI